MCMAHFNTVADPVNAQLLPYVFSDAGPISNFQHPHFFASGLHLAAGTHFFHLFSSL